MLSPEDARALRANLADQFNRFRDKDVEFQRIIAEWQKKHHEVMNEMLALQAQIELLDRLLADS